VNLLKKIKKWLRAPPTFARAAVIGENYDEQLIAVMRCVLRRNANCIDVGALAGDVIKNMIAIAPRGSHHAFEPIPSRAAALAQQITAATIHTCAVSDRSGTSEFQHVLNADGYSGLRRRIYDMEPEIETITVSVTTLDEAIPRDLKIALIKLDIEGGEYHAIRGGLQLIKRWRPYIAFEASEKSTGQYGVSAGQMYDLFAELNYDLSTMKRWLQRTAPLSRTEFTENWCHGPDFFWFASPRRP
jgi:FkbM family methyltransferase